MNKDFELILKAGAKTHVSMPATEAAFYVNAEELSGNNEKNFSAVLRRMEEAAGIEAIPQEQAALELCRFRASPRHKPI